MLTQPQRKTPYIGIFKLQSGEEFIGRVTDETDSSYVIAKPRCLVPTEQGVQFAPLMIMGNDDPVIVPKPVISGMPMDVIANQYESMISGIALPKKSSIIT